MIAAIILSAVLLATPSPSAATPSAKTQEILDRVTSQVARMSDQLRRTYTGTVKTMGSSSIVLNTPEGDRTVSTNDVTTFFRYRSGTRSETSFSSLKTGDDLAAVGTVDPVNGQMLAFQVIAKVHRFNVVGKIEAVEGKIVTVKEFTGASTKVNLTDSLSLKKNVGTIFSAAQMSDFKVGATVATICYLDSSSKSLSALKAVLVNY
jgi:hypothetical protein